MKTIVVFGGDGMLADSFKEVLQTNEQFSTYFFGKDKADITSLTTVERILEIIKPDYLINCAAYTNTNLAEIHVEKVYSVNLIGAIFVAIACKRRNIKLVHISSCFAKSPTNEYGMSKHLADLSVQEILGKDVYIPRLGWLFGSRKDQQFTHFVLTAIKNNTPIEVTNNSYGSPTYTLDAVNYILQRMLKNTSGIEEISNKGRVTRWEYCQEIFKVLKKKNNFKINDNFFEFARKPKDISLSGNLRPYEEALKEFLTARFKL